MVWDRERARCILFGRVGWYPGGGGAPAPTDVWEWDGAQWSLVAATAPSYRHVFMMCYDSRRRSTVVFSGDGFPPTSQTWELSSVSPPQVAQSGVPCVGANGAPTLRVAEYWQPWANGVTALEAGSFMPGASLVALVGASNSVWGALRLPLDLTPFGAPGCSLFSSGEIGVPGVANALGEAHFRFRVPNVPGGFYSQGFGLDRSANAAGWNSSNGLGIVIGQR